MKAVHVAHVGHVKVQLVRKGNLKIRRAKEAQVTARHAPPQCTAPAARHGERQDSPHSGEPPIATARARLVQTRDGTRKDARGRAEVRADDERLRGRRGCEVGEVRFGAGRRGFIGRVGGSLVSSHAKGGTRRLLGGHGLEQERMPLTTEATTGW